MTPSKEPTVLDMRVGSDYYENLLRTVILDLTPFFCPDAVFIRFGKTFSHVVRWDAAMSTCSLEISVKKNDNFDPDGDPLVVVRYETPPGVWEQHVVARIGGATSWDVGIYTAAIGMFDCFFESLFFKSGQYDRKDDSERWKLWNMLRTAAISYASDSTNRACTLVGTRTFPGDGLLVPVGVTGDTARKDG